jgi:cytochrome P450
MSPGTIIFDDPPRHDIHRALLAGVFKPRRIAELEPKIRQYCASALDPLVGKGGFDFVRDIGADVPMRTIGMLLGIPEDDQVAIRERTNDDLRLAEGAPPKDAYKRIGQNHAVFAEYIDWREKNPSDDIMTELLTMEFEDVTGTRRKLTRQEILGYVVLLAAAGNETTTRLIGWAGKLLAAHPDQRRELARDPSLIPGAIEEILRYESPSPVQARSVTEDTQHYGTTVKAGSIMLLLTAAANRDERRFPNADRFDIRRKIEHRLAQRRAGAHLDRPRLGKAPREDLVSQEKPYVAI